MTTRPTLLLLILALAACSPIAALAPPSPTLYRLSPEFGPVEDAEPVRWQLLVEPPEAPAAIAGSRVAIRLGENQYDYYADVGWADRAPVMLQSLILRAFEESGRIVSVGREQGGLRADYLLKTDIRAFDAVFSDENATPMIEIELAARLVRLPRRDIVAAKRFRAESVARSTAFTDVIAAFDLATAEALGELVHWSLEEGFVF